MLLNSHFRVNFLPMLKNFFAIKIFFSLNFLLRSIKFYFQDKSRICYGISAHRLPALEIERNFFVQIFFIEECIFLV